MELKEKIEDALKVAREQRDASGAGVEHDIFKDIASLLQIASSMAGGIHLYTSKKNGK